MNEQTLIEQLKQGPVAFKEVMQVIDQTYDFEPTAFTNGKQHNEAGQNNGSCKIFAFAQKHNLDKATTLNAFGDFYTQDVLNHPHADDHANIRQFMEHGWEGITFKGQALSLKAE